MTNATHTVRTVTEHRFIVPCPWPNGGDWKDFGIALGWAENVAKEHGISITTDDWSRLRVEDDQLVIVLTIEGPEREP
ncbi:hypothetical protein ACT17_15275 [Mycolicibacterium conceptionense]|uniref:Uncharacterized protein n=1 Tax=Mycolicibacterium conceptionense TaxID=451644 RepID=A0A0J8WX81_9MYCO|nr:hypothetical protein [Mycolicibacterium conceptionense]KMV17639.1 hypothetical protein ACT17_15275 [Mycolicibacterium conceptionense]